jgi:5-methylcytosine-specific restriction protein A
VTHAFQNEPRRSLSDQQRAKLFLDRGGKCEGPCGRRLSSKDVWHVDHRIALENGGTNDPPNLQILCAWCHKPKTASDAKLAAKGRAQAVAHVIPTSQRRKKGPPIPGSKRSKFKRKMDGTIERR